MHRSLRVGKGEKDRAGFWSSWQRQTSSSPQEPAVSRIHLTLKERIGIEVFVAMGCVAEQFLPALTRHHSAISSKLRQGSAKSGSCVRTADCRAMSAASAAPAWSPAQIACPLRLDLLDYPEDQTMRSSGRVSPAGLTWPHSPAIPAIVICAAPTKAGGGKHQRERRWSFATVFSKRYQLSQDHGKDGFGRRRTTEQPAAQMFTLPDSHRGF